MKKILFVAAAAAMVAVVNAEKLGAAGEEGECHKMLYKKCGEELHALKDAIEEVSILGIIKSVSETASCLVENMDDISKACVGGGDDIKKVDVVAATTATEMATEVTTEESRCHDKLYEECGDELKALKKAIEDTTPNGIVGASLELSGCITMNFVVLVKACSPFKNQDEMGAPIHSRPMQKHFFPPPPPQRDVKAKVSEQGEVTFSEEIDAVHFDFNDCVEMAKHQVLREYGHGKFRRHGFVAIGVLLLIIGASFAKGYHHGKKHHRHHHHHHHHPHTLIGKIIHFFFKILHFICKILHCCHHHDDDDDDDDNGGGPGAKIVTEAENKEKPAQYIEVAEESLTSRLA